jgi:multidrug efflux pump subunit AcrB
MILILMILVFQFSSLKKALLVLISVPFGALAGVAALFVTGQELSFFALLGILSLFGCALANAIVLIEYIENEIKLGYEPHIACRNAGKKRFRPILMSTMTTVLGLLPLVISGDPVFKPMASLLIVGLTVSMVMNLIFVPIVYDVMET